MGRFPFRSVRRACARAGLLCLFLTAARCAVAQETIVFDDVLAAGNPDVKRLDVGPWQFGSDQFHLVTSPTIGTLALVDNGTPYIASAGGLVDFPISLEHRVGLPFSLIGFDAGEGFVDDLAAVAGGFALGAESIQVVGALADGTFVLADFPLDDVRDGPAGAADFQSFTLPAEFHNVTSVVFAGVAGGHSDAAFALDNLVVAPVIPEPATMALGISAALSLLGFRRVRRLARHGPQWN